MTVGCAENYSALIMRQPGTATGQGVTPVVVGEITEIIDLEYNRLLSGTSTARIEFTRCYANCDFMSTPVKPWAYELWIYRDKELAWCGPIVIKKESRATESFELTAWDVTGWTTRRRIDDFYGNVDDPTSIANNLLQTFFDGTVDRNDPEFRSNVVFLGLATNTISVEWDEQQYQVGQKWVDLVNAGFNYTTMGRYTLIWGETAPNINDPFVLDASTIIGNMELIEDGTDFATRVTAMGEGGFSSQGPIGVDRDYYGTVDWPTVRYPGVTSIVELNNLAIALYNEKRDLSPTLVIPSGSGLAPDTEITPTGWMMTFGTQIALDELICGLRYDVQVASEQFCSPGIYPMQLLEVKVSWSPEGQEKIAVGFGTLGFPEA